MSVKRKLKSQAARKTTAKPAAKRKAKPPKVSTAKVAAKKAAASKKAVRQSAASKSAKPRDTFAKTKKTAKSKAKSQTSAAKPDRNSIGQKAALLDALDQATADIKPTPVPLSGERRGTETSGAAEGDRGQTPARINKLVPTNAVHTTKRRMKRNTWQRPVLALGAIAAVLMVLVLGNNNEPLDVSPLERRVEAQPSAPLPQTVQTFPRLQDPAQAAPDLKALVPSRLAQPALPLNRGGDTSQVAAQEPESPRTLKVLELVEMERMLARLEMDPSQADGVVDGQTETAIRTYQQIAGLPVDGEATPALLDDMREVVKMMDGTN